jgi:SAM-dependent methyltransferase
MREWIDWYDSDHPIYVNARHRDVHFRRIATDIVGLVPGPEAIVLDYSCGEALHADLVAARAARLILAEPAPGVRKRLSARYAGNQRVEVRALEELASLPARSVDLIVMHSVAQYMTAAELGSALDLVRTLLKPHGLFVLGDIVAPETPALVDALALLGFGLRNGFFLAALGGLTRTYFSDYWRLRGALGLTRYAEADLKATLAAHRLSAQRAPRNIGHNQARTSFLCAIAQSR